MKVKIVFVITAIISALIFLVYFQYTTPKVIRKEVLTNFTGVRIVNTPDREEDYLIKYNNREFYLSRFIFSDEEISSNFYDEFLSSVKNYTSEDHIQVWDYFGLALKFSGQERNGVILRKDNIVIIASGEEKDGLMKVVEWFVKKY